MGGDGTDRNSARHRATAQGPLGGAGGLAGRARPGGMGGRDQTRLRFGRPRDGRARGDEGEARAGKFRPLSRDAARTVRPDGLPVVRVGAVLAALPRPSRRGATRGKFCTAPRKQISGRGEQNEVYGLGVEFDWRKTSATRKRCCLSQSSMNGGNGFNTR